jgi:hypothetical protein
MNQTFEDILSLLLEWKEKNDNQDVVELLKEKKDELGLSEESMALVFESFDYIDKFSEKSASLAEAQDEGISRKRWLASDLEKSLRNFNEEEKTKIMDDVMEKIDETINSQSEEE